MESVTARETKKVKAPIRIPVCEPVLDGREEVYLLDCLKKNWISSGKFISEFEERFSHYCGAKCGVACSSGTAAIHLALAALGIGPGDEVIVPCFTLIACANMVILSGAKPVFVDADPKTWCLNPDAILLKLTPRTKAILAVHMYGHPCDMDRIMNLARQNGLVVIEDGAEAHGAEYKGRKVGGIGDAGCFSFYGNKMITTGEGGMVVTSRPDIAQRLRLLRNQAFEEPRFVHRHFGFNYRMSSLQAAVGLAQCENIEFKISRKRQIAYQYHQGFKGQPDIVLPYEAPWAKNVYWMYGLVLEEGFGCSRDAVMQRLLEQGIETRAFFYPLHRQPVYQDVSDPRFPDTSGHYPVSEKLSRSGLYLPSGLGLSKAQIAEVIQALLDCRP